MSKGGTLLSLQGAIFRGEKRASFADETGFPQRDRAAWGEKKKFKSNLRPSASSFILCRLK
jgi:hypothetical protein